jgi:hypothetical protein
MGNLAFLVFKGEAGVLWSGTVVSTGPFCALEMQVSWHQHDRLPLSGGDGFLLFNMAVGAFPWEGLVVSAGPP